jgi:hypothetical protein
VRSKAKVQSISGDSQEAARKPKSQKAKSAQPVSDKARREATPPKQTASPVEKPAQTAPSTGGYRIHVASTSKFVENQKQQTTEKTEAVKASDQSAQAGLFSKITRLFKRS